MTTPESSENREIVGSGTAESVAALGLELQPPSKVFVVFSYGDPMPITSCVSGELAEEYAAALARLPANHPLHTPEACVDELPLLSELPEPLRDPERQVWAE